MEPAAAPSARAATAGRERARVEEGHPLAPTAAHTATQCVLLCSVPAVASKVVSLGSCQRSKELINIGASCFWTKVSESPGFEFRLQLICIMTLRYRFEMRAFSCSVIAVSGLDPIWRLPVLRAGVRANAKLRV